MTWSRDLPTTIGDAIRTAAEIISTQTEILKKDSVQTEAELIVISAIGNLDHSRPKLSRLELLTKIKDPISGAAATRVLEYAALRSTGRPIQHVVGYQSFMGRDYLVTPDVLIPRQETEVLVTHAAEVLRGLAVPPNLGIEIGLGSGIISLELLKTFPSLRMIASEHSGAAMEIAKQNRHLHLGVNDPRLDVVWVKDGLDVIDTLAVKMTERSVDFFISNPPYLVKEDEIEIEVKNFEPATALFPLGNNGLIFYETMARRCATFLKATGVVLLEIPHERANPILELFVGLNWACEIVPDLTGRPRVLVARKKNG